MTAVAKSYRLSVLAGVLAGTVLVALAVTLLVQLLGVQANQSDRFSSIFTDARITRIVLFTIYQAGLSTLLSVILGAMLAWSLANQPKFAFRKALITLISSALVLPTLVVVLGIVSVYGRNGWLADINGVVFNAPLPFSIYGLSGILIAHVFFNASFAARILLHRFEAIAIEKHKLGHSLDLGLWQRLRVIDFPAIRGALPGLSVTIFLLCFTSFAIVLTLGGSPKYNTLEVAIYEAVKFDFDLLRALQLALVQIVICLFLVLATSAGNAPLSTRISVPGLVSFSHLQSAKQKWFQVALILLFATFFLAPLLAIVIDGTGPQLISIFKDDGFQRALLTSLGIATASTLIALAFSLIIASALVSLRAPNRLAGAKYSSLLTTFLSSSSMLYLVFPALVTGLGFFLIFNSLGGNPALWAGLVVIIANALIAIPFGIAVLRPAIFAAAQKQDRLSAAIGLGRMLRWRMIDWPMLRSDITYVAALAFCFSLGDLGVIALFGSDEFRTLPWLLYQKFGSYRTEDASAIALVLLALVTATFSLAQLVSSKEQST